jgi:hypothetical protein
VSIKKVLTKTKEIWSFSQSGESGTGLLLGSEADEREQRRANYFPFPLFGLFLQDQAGRDGQDSLSAEIFG